jgi:hypothetical protein
MLPVRRMGLAEVEAEQVLVQAFISMAQQQW